MNYVNKCATCVYFNPVKQYKIYENRYGKCCNKNSIPYEKKFNINFSRKKCYLYEIDPNKQCDCGVFIERYFNYCPKCGKKLRG